MTYEGIKFVVIFWYGDTYSLALPEISFWETQNGKRLWRYFGDVFWWRYYDDGTTDCDFSKFDFIIINLKHHY